MNEEIKKNEITEEEMEKVSGGTQDYHEIKYCPNCGHRMSVQWSEKDGVEVVNYYFCRNCTYRGG